MTHRIGEVLTAARAHAGSPSYSTIERALIPLLDDDTPSQQTLMRYHHGDVKSPDLVLLAALAKFYGFGFAAYGDDIIERFHHARDLLTSSYSWIPAIVGQETLFDLAAA